MILFHMQHCVLKWLLDFKKILKTKIFFSSMWIQLAASRRQNISPKKLTCSISRVPSKCLDRFTFPKSQTLKSVKWNYSFVCVYSRCILSSSNAWNKLFSKAMIILLECILNSIDEDLNYISTTTKNKTSCFEEKNRLCDLGILLGNPDK